MDKQRKTILFVEQYIPRAVRKVREHFKDTSVILIRDFKKRTKDKGNDFKGIDEVLYIDYLQPLKIASALLPYQDTLIAVTARGEEGANRLKSVIPHVPYLRTPTPESLHWATDKYEMRKRLHLFMSKNTPKFTKVKENSKKERKRVIDKINFPLVVKPANLQESMLVTICYHEEEFEKALRNVFRKLRTEYQKLNRIQLPTIMAEEFMDGDMYSVDTYINSRGNTFHCPMVRVRTGQNMGHDDFYSYSQTTPTALKSATVEKAQEVAENALHALGLRSVTAHIELMKVDDEWKIIEIGPRCGGFRDLLHGLSCDIDHSVNDILIRIPRKPIIPKKCKGFATAIKWYTENEGTITEMRGVKKIESIESFNSIIVNKKIGDKALFSKNGGKSIFNLFLYNTDRSKLLADIRRVEQMVEVIVQNSNGRVKKIAKENKINKIKKKSDKL